MSRLAVAALALLISGACAATAPQVDLVHVDKSERTLSLMADGKLVRRYRIVLGRSPVGAKTQEGDKRTPEGRYVLDFKKADSSYYRAIHVSYPNQQDRARAARS